jgi:hypothetical protein
MNAFVNKVENGRDIQNQARTQKVEEERDEKRQQRRRETVRSRVRQAIDRVVKPLQMVRGGEDNRTEYNQLHLVRADDSLDIEALEFPGRDYSKWVLRIRLRFDSPAEVQVTQASKYLITDPSVRSEFSVPASDLDGIMTMILELLAPACSEETVRQASHRIP